MSDDDDGNYVVDKRPSRVNLEMLRRRGGPTAADLEAMPATTAEDWKDAEIIAPLPKDIARELAARAEKRKGTL